MATVFLTDGSPFNFDTEESTDFIVERTEIINNELTGTAIYAARDSGDVSLDVAGHFISFDIVLFGRGQEDTAPGGDRADILVRAPGYVATLDGTAFVFRDRDLSLRNYGAIESTGDSPVVARSQVHEAHVLNLGTIRQTDGWAAVVVLHENGVVGTTIVDNRGQIDGGVVVNGGHLVVQNSGVISAPYTAIRTGDNYQGQASPTAWVENTGRVEGDISLSSQENRVFNHGTVMQQVYVNAPWAMVENHGLIGENIYIRNAELGGTVTNRGTVVEGLVVQASQDLRVMNSGEMGNVRVVDAVALLHNTGEITGDVWQYGGSAPLAYTPQLVLINHGTILGDVEFDHAGVFRGFGGRVDGAITGSDFDDLFYVDQAGVTLRAGAGHDVLFLGSSALETVTGIEEYRLIGSGDLNVISTEALDQLFRGNGGDNTFRMGEGDDTATGAGGDDRLFGAGGADVIDGGLGDDLLAGGARDDHLSGSHGNDTIFGNTGDDTLIGGRGMDRLEGGEGTDRMTGGLEADTFAFASLNRGGAVDRVTDFTGGEDRIDLTAIAYGASFIGQSAFAANGLAQVNYRFDGHARIWVALDADGDGLRDGEILLESHASLPGALSAGDFIL